ncbi:MAG: serine/threonine-protein kinase, partial [Planctomycetota bacterium]
MRQTSNLEASELISRSLSGSLTDRERDELDRYMQENDVEQTEATQSFAELSAAIAKSAIIARDLSREEGLSEIAKERLKKSVRKAKFDSMASHTAGSQVADPRTVYFSSGDQQEEPPEESRQAVSRFTLLQKIGEGGLGTVWLARDERLHRNVALKEMNPKAAGSKRLWRRFQREAEITGHLEHPNVVPLHMSGVNPETGLPFYVMRFLGKQTLAEAIQEYHAKVAANVEEPLDLHRLLNVFLKVCQALAYAHSRGVIHRDLKPENVILDNFGQVIVLDWGLAKMVSDGELALRLSLNGDLSDSNLGATLDGDIVGTPLYMGPEQAAGDLNAIDERTDVYGLGAILFAILTGNAPHENSNLSRDGTLQVQGFLDSIVNSETKSPREINPDVPKDLEAICMRAMAKKKFARHASATDLASDVELWIAGSRQKESEYNAMRMAGRDLKSRLCVQMRELIALTLFMVELPPIQGLIQSVDQDKDEFAVWRDRLSQILLALIRVKPSMSGNSYCRIEGERAKELVRVERSPMDKTNVRNVPQSRLRDSIANKFQLAVMEQFPGECAMDFDCTASGTVRLVCGVPVFDDSTEEPFGMVVAEAEVGNLVRPELELSKSGFEALLLDDAGNVLFSTSAGGDSKRGAAKEGLGNWEEVRAVIDVEQEYLDPNREIYATRLPLPKRQ